MKARTVPPDLRRFLIRIIALASLSAAYTVVMTLLFHKPYPYGLPMFHPDRPFWDFTIFRIRFEHFGTSAFWDTFNYPFTYPPAMGVVFAAFYRTQHALALYLALWAMALGVAMAVLIGALVRRGVPRGFAALFSLALPLTSWPVGYLINRANIEGIVVIVTAAAILALWHERWGLGACLIGFAAALKLFPVILLALLLSRRRYKEFAAGVGVMLLVSWLSLWMLGPSVSEALHHVLEGLAFFDRRWAATLSPSEVGFDHSLFTLIKIPLSLAYLLSHASVASQTGSATDPRIATPILELALRVYSAAVAILGTVLYFTRIRRLPMLNQILALSICMVLLPPVSFDYTLVHLYAPVGLFCVYVAAEFRRGRRVQAARSVFVSLAVILTMNAYVTLVVRWAGQLRAIMLVALLYHVLQNRFEPDAPALG